MKVLVIGAHGKIGRRLLSQLAEAGFGARAMVRDPDQASELDGEGIEIVAGDLEGEFESAFDGCDAVVFTAGSGGHTGGDKTLLVDLWGALRSYEAARKAGVTHFVMVSSLKSAEPDLGPVKMRHYLVAKHVADDYLVRSGLPYLILRPGGLTEDPGGGGVTLAEHLPGQQGTVPRADVAAVITEVLRVGLKGKILDLVSGDTPVPEAVAAWMG